MGDFGGVKAIYFVFQDEQETPQTPPECPASVRSGTRPRHWGRRFKGMAEEGPGTVSGLMT